MFVTLIKRNFSKSSILGFKLVTYFGEYLIVPKETIAIATDKNGFINFYKKGIPEPDLNIWFSDKEQESESILLETKTKNVSIDDWKKTLVTL